ncbi:beta-1,3-galactosyltransferase 1-like [Patiria miniata]|uniref:Hexosyltransferase n=1 Tax=Patiria miniata TaxID=46514 RepID=A0A913ZQJ3_PATMI|nr:beta-1,3-galactosyltransferase 1-like [Patiria miniata]XP_038053401.1 beta-1,3-galactosyltransferase 1-like [Patiria miniata]
MRFMMDAIIKCPGNVTLVVVCLIWAATILLVIDTKLNYTLDARDKECSCASQQVSTKESKDDQVQTRTVVKWLTYCRKEIPVDSGSEKTTVPRSKARRTHAKKSPPLVNPHPYDFTITNADACAKGANRNGYVDALCLVLTAPSDSYTRTLIRKTWASVRRVKGKRIVTMFLLGQRDEETQFVIGLEDNHYHDIIQENFYDSYYNLTLKTIMGLRWAARFCPNARYILKVDVDMFVNVYNLVDRLDTAPTHNFAEGNLKDVTKPIRNRQSKWYTSPEVYPNKTYPPYMSGPAYLMSGDLSARIFGTSLQTSFLPWEDAYVGIIMHKIKVQLSYNAKFDNYLDYRNEQDMLRKINECITFHLGEDKEENKDNIVMVWNRVRMLNDIPVLE